MDKQKKTNLLIAFWIIALGFLIMNQAYGFYYKMKLLNDPCSLCQEFVNSRAVEPQVYFNSSWLGNSTPNLLKPSLVKNSNLSSFK